MMVSMKLQSVFQLIDLYDYIYIRIRSDTQINFINESIEIDNQDDLGLKAARLILKDKNIGVDIYIKKNIPLEQAWVGEVPMQQLYSWESIN